MPHPDPVLEQLFAAARSAVPDTARLEFAFETRLLARLRQERASGVFAWAWKLAPFFAAVVVALGVWNRATTAHLNTTASMVADALRQHPDRVLLSLVERAR